MTDRDAEYNKLMHELKDTPFIEKPDRIDVDVGGACFLNQDRVCGPDCTAFGDAEAPTAAERCTILSGMNTGLELLQDLIQLSKRSSARPTLGARDVPPPNPMPRQGGR